MRSILPLVLLSASLPGCSARWMADEDADHDGVSILAGDCWDDPTGPAGSGLRGDQIHPDAGETWYDGVDQDCGGEDDYDQDGDGFASALHPGAGGVAGDDCWDDLSAVPDAFVVVSGTQPGAAEVHPGAADAWYDGVDQDCAGDDDFDQDGDGWRSAAWPDRDGIIGEDCMDAVEDALPADETCTGVGDPPAPADIHPEAEDLPYDGVDADCAGDGDFDADADGWPSCEECDDADPTREPDPSIPEVWYDGEDQNCDGNDGDQDGDRYYDASYAFAIPASFSPGDCWDDPTVVPSGYDAVNALEQPAADAVHPGAQDVPYDGVDADCAADGDFDADGDGFTTRDLPDRDGGYGEDCDDADAAVAPGAVDVWYDGTDANCDDADDYDQDRDGQRAEGYGAAADGFTDCDDTAPATYLGAPETCDGVDSDCDDDTNDPGAAGCTNLHADADGDGYGATADLQCLCVAEAPYTATATGDCDDAAAAVNPGARESCATVGVDDDCSDGADEPGAQGCTTWYYDGDGDTFGSTTSQCACAASGDYDADDDDDCDDARASVNPSASETCNDRDDDCDSAIDDGLTLYYPDADADGFGDVDATGDCGTSGVTDHTDCDDGYAFAYPGADEVCDGEDNDCDASTGEDGMVSHLDGDGATWTDYTSTWAAASPFIFDVPADGTLYVCAGTYHARLRTTSTNASTVHVLGVEGAGSTVLDADGAGAVLGISAGHVTIEGLTITGGIGSNLGSGNRGGGAAIVYAASSPSTPTLTLVDCEVTGNTATYGGALYASLYGSIALEGTQVHGNTATSGGAVYIDVGRLTCADSATAAGGVFDNTASSQGGGAYLSSAALGSVVSTGCDWGTSAAGDDNSPDDVNIRGSASSYGTNATFTCTPTAGCR